jgi:hypothetical protein
MSFVAGLASTHRPGAVHAMPQAATQPLTKTPQATQRNHSSSGTSTMGCTGAAARRGTVRRDALPLSALTLPALLLLPPPRCTPADTLLTSASAGLPRTLLRLRALPLLLLRAAGYCACAAAVEREDPPARLLPRARLALPRLAEVLRALPAGRCWRCVRLQPGVGSVAAAAMTGAKRCRSFASLSPCTIATRLAESARMAAACARTVVDAPATANHLS